MTLPGRLRLLLFALVIAAAVAVGVVGWAWRAGLRRGAAEVDVAPGVQAAGDAAARELLEVELARQQAVREAEVIEALEADELEHEAARVWNDRRER